MWYELIFKSDGWEEGELFHDEAIAADGKKIVKMSEACPGYWDITFEDGTALDAVHTLHIVTKSA